MGEALVTLAAGLMTLLSSRVAMIIMLVLVSLAIWAPRFRWVCITLVAGYFGLAASDSGQAYGDCVALKWDRKHPEEARARNRKEWQRWCERLRGKPFRCSSDLSDTTIEAATDDPRGDLKRP